MILHIRIAIACLLISLNLPNLNAQPITWQKTYGGTNMDYGYSIVQTPDEGFIAVGNSSLIPAMRLDRFGNIVWSRVFPQVGGKGIVALSDGNFVISGSYSFSNIIKIDLNGNVIWTLSNEAGYLEPSRDSGFFVSSNSILKKFSNSGSVLWAFDYSDYLNSAEPWGIGITPANDVLILGVVHDSLPGLNRFILKVNSFGQFEFFRRFNSIYWPNRVVCPDSNSLVYSSIRDRSVFLVKYDLNGNLLWSQKVDTLIPPNAATSLEDLVECNDKGFAMTGWYHAGDYDFFVRVIRTDMSGNLQWKRLYGFGDADFGYCIRQTRDSGFAVIGTRDNYNLGDIYIIKTDKSGYADPPVGVSNNHHATVNETAVTEIYPNPFNGQANIRLSLQERSVIALVIFDNSGRQVDYIDLGEMEEGNNVIAYTPSGLSSGIYFCKVVGRNFTNISKLVLLK